MSTENNDISQSGPKITFGLLVVILLLIFILALVLGIILSLLLGFIGFIGMMIAFLIVASISVKIYLDDQKT